MRERGYIFVFQISFIKNKILVRRWGNRSNFVFFYSPPYSESLSGDEPVGRVCLNLSIKPHEPYNLFFAMSDKDSEYQRFYATLKIINDAMWLLCKEEKNQLREFLSCVHKIFVSWLKSVLCEYLKFFVLFTHFSFQKWRQTVIFNFFLSIKKDA